jgi:preprotein translocase subunit SecG
MLLMLAWNTYVLGALMVLFLIICGLVILTVLVQRPQGGGLAGAFGGGSGSGQTAFGTKTGDALTVLTISMFVVYLLAAILLNYGIKAAANPDVAVPSVAAPNTEPAPSPLTAPATGTPDTTTPPAPAPAEGAAAPASTPATTPATAPPATAPDSSAPQTPPAAPAAEPSATPANPGAAPK